MASGEDTLGAVGGETLLRLTIDLVGWAYEGVRGDPAGSERRRAAPDPMLIFFAGARVIGLDVVKGAFFATGADEAGMLTDLFARGIRATVPTVEAGFLAGRGGLALPVAGLVLLRGAARGISSTRDRVTSVVKNEWRRWWWFVEDVFWEMPDDCSYSFDDLREHKDRLYKL